MSGPPARVLSTSPFTYTKLPPLVPVGLAVILFVFDPRRDLNSLGLLAAIAAVAYVAMRAGSGGSGLADKVYDGGDHLVIHIGREEERIFLNHIESVTETHRSRPPRIQLTLKYSSKFGREIDFIPAGLFKMSGGKSAVFHELEERVRAAHEGTGFATR